MADLKISQLTGATTPLAGTEVLPIVQSSTTRKVAVSDLTAGRDVATKAITTTLGNITVNGAASGTALTVNSNLSATTGVQTVANFYGITSSSTDQGYAAVIRTYTKNANGNYWNTGFGAANSLYGSNYADAVIYWGNTGNALVEGVRLQAVSGDVQVSTGNIVPSTAAKGINFTANTPAAGMTSQLLNWYEEGTWTPTQGAGLTVVGAFTSSGTYTRIGRLVTATGVLNGATSIAVAAGGVLTTGLPFNAGAVGSGAAANANANSGSVLTQVLGGGTIYSVSAITASTSITFSITYPV